MQFSHNRQSAIGLLFAATLFATWIVVHFWAMFAFTMGWHNWPLVPLIFALQCWLSVGMFIVAHDAMHGSLAPGQPRLNSAIGAILLFFYAGFGWKKMRDAHFDHHRHVGSARDPDFNVDNPKDFWPWYAVFLKRYFGWQSMLFVWSVVLVYYFIADVPAQNIALLYGFPAIASSLQLFYFGTYQPHRHEEAPFPDHHGSRTNDYGTLTSLFSCFHFGYHHEHHLSPATPWWGLPQRRREYLSDRAKT
jgi:beta-carotene/zeaxanthin 4-ketolase